MKATVTFGIVGCGGIGRWHAKCLRSIASASVGAVADADLDVCAEAAKALGVARAESVQALLDDGAIDVVSICTPPDTHAPLIERAAAAGKHVLVEKPLAVDLDGADLAIEACRQAGVHLGVVHQQRARSASRLIHALVSEGAFGRPQIVSAVHTWYRKPDELTGHAWRGRSSPGGGVLLDQAVHAVDLLVWFLGTPRWVAGAQVSPAHDPTAHASAGEDSAVATVGFKGGVLATLAASTTANRARDDIAIDFSGTRGGFRLEIRDYDHAEIPRLDLADSDEARARALAPAEIEARIREHGGAWRTGPRSIPWRMIAAIGGKDRGAHPFRSPRAFARRQADRVAQGETGELQGHAAVLERMAATVRGEGEPVATGLDARVAIAVIDAVRRSLRDGGRRVEIDEPELP